MSEVFRVLRPRGKFLSIEPLRTVGTIIPCPLLSWKFLSKKKCINLLRKSGFVKLNYKYKNALGHFIVEKPN